MSNQEEIDKLQVEIQPERFPIVFLEGNAKGGYLDDLQMRLEAYASPSSAVLELLSKNLLPYAIESGNKHVVDYLIRNATLTSDDLIDDIIIALKHGYSDIYHDLIGRLRPSKRKLSKFLRAAVEGGEIDVVRQILQERPTYLQKALETAAEYGKEKIVDELLPAASDVGKALKYAAKNGHESIVRKLVPLINNKKYINKAINAALKEGQLDITHILLPYDNPSKRWKYLISAVEGADIEAVEEFLPTADIEGLAESFRSALRQQDEALGEVITSFVNNIDEFNDALGVELLLPVISRLDNATKVRMLLRLNPQRQYVMNALNEARGESRQLLEEYLELTM